MDRCTVCGSANLNKQFGNPVEGTGGPIWWCEDCGSLHLADADGPNIQTWRPEKSMLHHQVLAFHKRFGQVIGARPHVPDEKTLRFRLSLVAEEFFEMLDAAGYYIGAIERGAVEAGDLSKYKHNPAVDLPALVDALADLDYVIEGFRITMGVDGGPIADEVQRANMAKLPSYVAAKDALHRGESLYEAPPGAPPEIAMAVGIAAADAIKREDGKILKPPGWVGPDIERVLIEQGWKP